MTYPPSSSCVKNHLTLEVNLVPSSPAAQQSRDREKRKFSNQFSSQAHRRVTIQVITRHPHRMFTSVYIRPRAVTKESSFHTNNLPPRSTRKILVRQTSKTQNPNLPLLKEKKKPLLGSMESTHTTHLTPPAFGEGSQTQRCVLLVLKRTCLPDRPTQTIPYLQSGPRLLSWVIEFPS